MAHEKSVTVKTKEKIKQPETTARLYSDYRKHLKDINHKATLTNESKIFSRAYSPTIIQEK